jgi:tetratricopeptide (TPR) repeat protein
VKAPESGSDQVVTELPVVQDNSEPASRQVAESYFSKMDFEKAMAVYERLYQRLASNPDNDAARDFLVWRMALCAKGQGRSEQALTLLRQPAHSRFPVVRALARYHLGLAAIQQQQYLEAMGEVYQALALADALQGQRSWNETFKRSCRFLIAKAITLEALSLRETQEDWPASLWTPPSVLDLWGSLDDEPWRQALQSGVQTLGEASLGPRIEAVTETPETGGLWKVVSNGAPLEEVVLRFAAQAKLNLTWSVTSVSGTSTVDPATRRRPSFVYVTGATAQDALTQVAGAARLSVRVEPSGKMALVDPLNYRSLGEHIAGLRQQAMSLWIQLRLISQDQGAVPTTHFALGLLYEQNDQAPNAIAEYGLLVSRFPQSDLAPQALLRSSRLRTGLRDYAGARQVSRTAEDSRPYLALQPLFLYYVGSAVRRA